MDDWTLLGEGEYNKAYTNQDRTLVFKRSKHDFEGLTVPDREVRIWNEINDHIETPAYTHKRGWIAPYIHGFNSTIPQITHAVIDIYNRTGRIILDAFVQGNFKTTPQGDVICVDVDYALLPDREQAHSGNGHQRRRSIASLDVIDTIHRIIRKMVKDYRHPKAASVLNIQKALFYIAFNFPSVTDVSCLKHHPELVNQLSEGFDYQDPKYRNSRPETDPTEAINEAFRLAVAQHNTIDTDISTNSTVFSHNDLYEAKAKFYRVLHQYRHQYAIVNLGCAKVSLLESPFSMFCPNKSKIKRIHNLMDAVNEAESVDYLLAMAASLRTNIGTALDKQFAQSMRGAAREIKLSATQLASDRDPYQRVELIA